RKDTSPARTTPLPPDPATWRTCHWPRQPSGTSRIARMPPCPPEYHRERVSYLFHPQFQGAHAIGEKDGEQSDDDGYGRNQRQQECGSFKSQVHEIGDDER